MATIDSSIIRYLLAKRPRDLLALMDGEGEYRKDAVTNKPRSREELMIFKMARDHVWFKSEFGGDVKNACIGDKVYEEFPQYFDQWINLGCPVLDADVLELYLERNPLNEESRGQSTNN